jgi:hypothetical protein
VGKKEISYIKGMFREIPSTTFVKREQKQYRTRPECNWHLLALTPHKILACSAVFKSFLSSVIVANKRVVPYLKIRTDHLMTLELSPKQCHKNPTASESQPQIALKYFHLKDKMVSSRVRMVRKQQVKQQIPMLKQQQRRVSASRRLSETGMIRQGVAAKFCSNQFLPFVSLLVPSINRNDRV